MEVIVLAEHKTAACFLILWKLTWPETLRRKIKFFGECQFHSITSYCTCVARTINELFNIPPHTCTPTPLEFSFSFWMLLKVLVFQLHLILIKLREKIKPREGERNRVASVISSDPFLTLSCQASLGIDTSDEDMKWWVCVEAGQAPSESPRFSLG